MITATQTQTREEEMMTDFQFKALLKMFGREVINDIRKHKTPEEAIKAINDWIFQLTGESVDNETNPEETD
jgi:DNA polymerase elongation subunit (family B)